jgi:hypothetical protein
VPKKAFFATLSGNFNKYISQNTKERPPFMSTDSTEYQVVLEIAHSSKVHVIAEYPTKEKALDGYMKLVAENKNSPVTSRGKYTIRKKPV